MILFICFLFSGIASLPFCYFEFKVRPEPNKFVKRVTYSLCFLLGWIILPFSIGVTISKINSYFDKRL